MRFAPPTSRLEEVAADAGLQEKSLSDLQRLADTLQDGVEQAEREYHSRSECVCVCVQWNLSNQDTNGVEVSEVSSFQRLKCMQEWCLGWEKVSCLEKCPQVRVVSL